MLRPKLSVTALESRDVPATFLYSPVTQNLTINAADNDNIDVRIAGPDAPTGYLTIFESGTEVFSSLTNNQPIRSIFANFSSVPNGSLLIGPAVRLSGNLDVMGARSNSEFIFNGQVGGNISYRDVAGAADTITIDGSARTGGNLSLTLSEGVNTVKIKTATVGGNLTVGGRSGADTVELLETGAITVGGVTSFNLGSGSNSVVGKAANRLTTGRDFVYAGLAGVDSFDFRSNGSDITAGGTLRMTLGGPFVNQPNFAWFDNTVVGNYVSVIGGVGNDDIRFANGLTVGTDVTISAGDGLNYLDMNTLVTTPNTIGGRLTYTGGKGADQIYMDGTTVGKGVLFDLKDAITGTQFIEMGYYMPAGNRIYGSLGIKSGSGNELITISRTEVYNGLIVDLGLGNDSLWIDDSLFLGTSRINMGTGNDFIYMETLTADGYSQALNGFVSFGGLTTILGGIGDDTLNISNDNNVATNVKFGARLTLDGGLGTDTLLLSPEALFFGGLAPLAY